MAGRSLEEFVRAVQSNVSRAQKALNETQQKARVERQVQLNGDSDVEGETWSMAVNTGEVRDGKPVVVQVPLMSLTRVTETKLTAMQIKLSAKVERVRAPDGGDTGLLSLRLIDGPPAKGKGTYEVTLDLTGENLEEVEVSVDGKFLKRFGRDGNGEEG